MPRRLSSATPWSRGDADVERQQNRRRGVDRHTGADLAEVDAVEEDAHVFERADGDAALADLAKGERVVTVAAHERGQVEGGAETVLALLEQILEAFVRVAGAAEAGELAHGPAAVAVHGLVDAARVGKQPGLAETIEKLDPADVVGAVEPLDGDARDRGRITDLRRRAWGPG